MIWMTHCMIKFKLLCYHGNLLGCVSLSADIKCHKWYKQASFKLFENNKTVEKKPLLVLTLNFIVQILSSTLSSLSLVSFCIVMSGSYVSLHKLNTISLTHFYNKNPCIFFLLLFSAGFMQTMCDERSEPFYWFCGSYLNAP